MSIATVARDSRVVQESKSWRRKLSHEQAASASTTTMLRAHALRMKHQKRPAARAMIADQKRAPSEFAPGQGWNLPKTSG